MPQIASPLCLPNNCHWNEATNEYHTDDAPRTSLLPTASALRALRAIEGPVCVVSVVGPCRKGKSYILSRVFDQGEVFPLGHTLDPETMGMWLWVVPGTFQDPTTGQKFTVVLLDSEGMGAANAEATDDHSIFTLTVLISRILIYNSAGVPARQDLEELNHVINLSKRIEILSNKDLDPSECRKVFPSFVWLLRDVLLDLPEQLKTLKEYFVEKVFKINRRSSENAEEVEKNILELFADFDAFKLPLPSDDPEVVQHMNDERHQRKINPEFTKGVLELQKKLREMLSPNRSLDGELVTGEALALMVEEYTRTLNRPGAVPCVQRTWQLYVDNKCLAASSMCLGLYEDEMNRQLGKKGLPCDEAVVRDAHLEASLLSTQHFEFETIGIELHNSWSFLEELGKKEEEMEKIWLEKNILKTKEFYRDREAVLRSQYLDPVLERVYADKQDFASTPTELHSAYCHVTDEFARPSKGPRELCARIVRDFREKLRGEKEKKLELLMRLKKNHDDYDSERLALRLEREEIIRLQEAKASTARELKQLDELRAATETQHHLDQMKAMQTFESRMKQQRDETERLLRQRNEQFRRDREAIFRQTENLETAIRAGQRAVDERDQEVRRLRAEVQRRR